MRISVACIGLTLFTVAHAAPERFDLIVRNGTVYDGTGGPGKRVDVGVRGDRIAVVGDLSAAKAGRVVDAKGMAVAPDSSTCCRGRPIR